MNRAGQRENGVVGRQDSTADSPFAAEVRGPGPGLAGLLRERTRRLHAAAERSGFVRRILTGRADRAGYALLLRNLLPVYRELEAALQRRRCAAGVRRIFEPDLFRARGLESDLRAIGGPGWGRALPLLTAGEVYASRVAACGRRPGGLLVAHAYVRYLGDLSGGLVLPGLLRGQLGLGEGELSFYRYEGIADPAAFKLDFRRALDRAGAELPDHAPLAEEAAVAFRLNIALSEAVEAWG